MYVQYSMLHAYTAAPGSPAHRHKLPTLEEARRVDARLQPAYSARELSRPVHASYRSIRSVLNLGNTSAPYGVCMLDRLQE
jgi:hypothetical protein